MLVAVKITKRTENGIKVDDHLFKSETVPKAVEFVLKAYDKHEAIECVEASRVEAMDITDNTEIAKEKVNINPDDFKLPDTITIPYTPYTPITVPTPQFDQYTVTCGGK